MNDFEETQRLIRLKRYEQPPDGYFENFLDEFHLRQRTEMVKRSSRSLFFERLGTYFSDISKSRLLMAGGAAYALLMLGLMLRPAAPDPATAADKAPRPEFDAPQGTVLPVSASPSQLVSPVLDPQIDLLNGFISPFDEGAGRAPFVLPGMLGAPRADGRDEIIEL